MHCKTQRKNTRTQQCTVRHNGNGAVSNRPGGLTVLSSKISSLPLSNQWQEPPVSIQVRVKTSFENDNRDYLRKDGVIDEMGIIP
jgi:hypothetical protein